MLTRSYNRKNEMRQLGKTKCIFPQKKTKNEMRFFLKKKRAFICQAKI